MSSPDIMIVFWGNPLYDGRCVNMINQFRDEKLTVKIIGVGKDNKTFDFNGAKIKLIDHAILNNSLTKYFKYFKLIKRILKQESPKTIIASDLYSLIPCAQFKQQQKVKLIYDSREIYTQLAGLVNRPIIQKIWSWYEKKYIYSADYVIANAEIDQEYLKDLYPKISIKIFKNLPGSGFLNAKKIDIRDMLCIDRKTKIILYQGKLHNGRGIRFILTCLKHLGDVALVVVGDGPMKKSYINTARKEDVSDKLFFVDSVPYTDLASFSKSADIGVTVIQPISKSYENALPNKLFEYAVSGLPVICSNLVAMKEMVSVYKCGISIPPTDLNAFIEAFNTINKNENNFKIGINLQKELLWENQNKQLIELIK